MRTVKIYQVDAITSFQNNLFDWAQQFETSAWLDSNNYQQNYSNFDVCLAADEFTSIKTDFVKAFDKLKEYQSNTKDYIFGYLSYDLKNDVEQLTSNNFDGLGFADLYFFQPQKLIFIKGNQIEFHYLAMIDEEIDTDFQTIKQFNSLTIKQSKNLKIQQTNNLKIKLRIHKDAYQQKVHQILENIKRGDIYETNFCQEFYATNAIINPHQVYKDLNTISEPPFATFFKHQHHFVLSSSPERYIKKEGEKVISQPIKGTAKRLISKFDDEKIAEYLAKDEKERAENIMIVDLVRNDLSRTAKKGTVKVEELCKVYTFKQVHQLISTVVCEVEPTTNPVDILKSTFPMGSMTGAPKVSAMQIIEDVETTKRGLYSGAVGYITPTNDFDFNVIIRSILYNQKKQYVSFSVGSAITIKSNPEKEYEECLLKAKAMKQVLLS